ncbi:nitrate reductase molybdenum cofactor assembly chaperone [Actinomadura atramentaria]|uniref:nitrate reductase molybdenum cofactor assembly chaperone n=1 Tax=Actinomadura atramentaria TaxID=1990 RepID=UPI00037FD4FF|nr:nitrate reductase molybdenum cofactor assembly chaperone [Actinomadura atramentaria]
MNAVVWQAASLLLEYPTDELYARRPLLRAAVADLPAGEPAARLAAFLDHLDAVPLGALARDYVATFDLRRRCCLYLTYYRDGDTRRRGASLVALKERYRAAGVEPATRELPDFLPVVLEFAALHGGADLLAEHRAGLELLRLALRDRSSPYAAPVEAVCATLPGPAPRDRAEALRLARTGPPGELVGLELGLRPFGPGGTA